MYDCPTCGRSISHEAAICPGCGLPDAGSRAMEAHSARIKQEQVWAEQERERTKALEKQQVIEAEKRRKLQEGENIIQSLCVLAVLVTFIIVWWKGCVQ